MKKILVYLIVLSAFLLDTACSGSGGDDTPPPVTTSIRAMTFNIRYYNDNNDPVGSGHHWTERREHIVTMIGTEKPSVLGTQEGVLDIQEKWLEENLSDYDRYGVSLTGFGYNGAVSVYWRKDILTKVESGEFWLSETPEVQGSVGWDADQTRMTTWVKLKHLKTGKSFYVFNTHLDHIGEKARENSVPLIVEKIKAINTANEPVILMGDFNSDTSNPIFAPLQQYMYDARVRSTATDTGATFNNWSTSKSVIDHIFYRGSLVPTVFSVLRGNYGIPYLSDHYPVRCDFIIL